MSKKDVGRDHPVSEWPESQCSLARALYIVDLSTQQSAQPNWNDVGRGGEAPNSPKKKRWTDLFRGVGAEHDGVFRADNHFILNAHSDAVKVFGELGIGRDVDTF